MYIYIYMFIIHAGTAADFFARQRPGERQKPPVCGEAGVR